MKYAEVRKLFEMLCEFDPNSMEGVYQDDYLFANFQVSYKETLVGLKEYLDFWNITLKEA